MQRRRSFKQALLLHVMPFCYGAATRVPFAFVALHALLQLQCRLPTVALVLGAYQVSRVVCNCLVGVLGSRTALPLGAAAGLLGYYSLMSVAAATKGSSACYSDGGSSWSPDLCRLVCSLALVGCSEQIVALQDFCKATYCGDTASLRQNLQLLYASNVCGTAAGFLLSGVSHHLWGLAGPSGLGLVLEAGLLLGAVTYTLSMGGAPPAAAAAAEHRSCSSEGHETPGPGQQQQQQEQPIEPIARAPSLLQRTASAMAVGLSAPPVCLVQGWGSAGWDCHKEQLQLGAGPSGSVSRGRQALRQASAALRQRAAAHKAEPATGGLANSVAAGQESAGPAAAAAAAAEGAVAQLADLGGDGGRPPWISFVLAAAMCNQALLIGTCLSTAPILMGLRLRLAVLHVGLTFAAGEALGSAALLYASTAAGRALLRRWLPMPLSLLAVLLGMGAASLVLPLLPGTAAPLVCLVVIFALNDVGTSLLAECQGATLPARHYSRMNALGNTLRRLGNTVTCVSSPALFASHPALPFVLFGSLTLVWAVLLAALFGRRAQELRHLAGVHAQIDDGRTATAACAAACSRLPDPWSQLHRYTQLSFVSMEGLFWERPACRVRQ